MPELPIRSYIDLSTAHLPQDEMDLLSNARDVEGEDNGLPLTRVIPHAYGAWVWVPTDDFEEHAEQLREDGRLPHLEIVLAFAHKQGCNWINFDRDGETVEALPTWSW